MADARMRNLARQERTDLETQVRLLWERVRLGELREDRLLTFASLGHAPAAHALGLELPDCGAVAKALSLLDAGARVALLEAAVFCTERPHAEPEREASEVLRPEELAPSAHPWANENMPEVVAEAQAARRSVVRAGGWVDEFDVTSLPGRLLAYDPDYSLFDGLTENLSGGFFDEFDCPPWATWVHVGLEFVVEGNRLGPCIVAWVPPSLREVVGRAMGAEAGWALYWLDEIL